MSGTTKVEALEQRLAAAFGRIDGVRQALDYEPDIDEPLELPAITLFWTDVSQDNTTTGPDTDNSWSWDVNVYTNLETEDGFRGAQQTMKRIVAQVLTYVRENPKVDDLADQITITDGGPPVFVTGEGTGYLLKTLRISARTTER